VVEGIRYIVCLLFLRRTAPGFPLRSDPPQDWIVGCTASWVCRSTAKQNAIRQNFNAVRGLKTKGPAELRCLFLLLDAPKELLGQLDEASRVSGSTPVG
jgi:hypothetical protein